MDSATFLGEVASAAEAVLSGVEALMRFFEQAAAGAETECLAVLPVTGRTLIAPAAAQPLFQRIIGRGVDVKVLYPEAARFDPGIAGYARWATDLGVAVRTAVAAPPTMMVFDRRLVLLPLDQEDRTRGAATSSDPAVVGTLAWLFHQVWLRADLFGCDRPEADDGSPTDVERRLLRLLAEGETDESAARRLALSVRSERRVMADLMGRLGAVSRFQAGHAATRRGWL